MSSRVEVSGETLREWTLPEPDDSKYSRGQVVVVGGALKSPGAAMLAGTAALRVGAGRLTLAVGASVAAHVAVAVPECGVVPLDETPGGSVSGFSLAAASDDLERADAVLLGPGLDDAEEAEVMVRELARHLGDDTVVVLDAFGLGVVPSVPQVAQDLGGRLVLTPNKVEAALLLERDVDDLEADLVEIAERYRAVVACYGIVTAPSGDVWIVDGGGPGLGTSGSGDVLAGAIAGLCARGASPEQAAVWASFLHVAVGDRLSARIAPLGFLAGDMLGELPSVLEAAARKG
ncbi:NAD(P)H-hydrate dehydratase [Conyzicola nivalis]|uniref:ADP-dependent (S)-NAD(P)H-hydrate dehydratase n=1 Tax=Conyzicola nivalis TaxID=1477021 RepID=A0A916SG39_9MICO|nr:NAD(P)H-hydrate dehydratase [Conyzicola nivalis]GGA99140.1 ADP-dependent (S)-NAD(P)H-hydrate dehydratase [Conyzicola nivalis]